MTQNDVRCDLKRKVYDMRLKTIAEKTGVPADIVSKFMRGERDLWPEHLEKIALYLEAH